MTATTSRFEDDLIDSSDTFAHYEKSSYFDHVWYGTFAHYDRFMATDQAIGNANAACERAEKRWQERHGR